MYRSRKRCQGLVSKADMMVLVLQYLWQSGKADKAKLGGAIHHTLK